MIYRRTHDGTGLVIYSGERPCYFKYVVRGAELDTLLLNIVQLMRDNGRNVSLAERWDTEEQADG